MRVLPVCQPLTFAKTTQPDVETENADASPTCVPTIEFAKTVRPELQTNAQNMTSVESSESDDDLPLICLQNKIAENADENHTRVPSSEFAETTHHEVETENADGGPTRVPTIALMETIQPEVQWYAQDMTSVEACIQM